VAAIALARQDGTNALLEELNLLGCGIRRSDRDKGGVEENGCERNAVPDHDCFN
jgi:hypothetical protein